MKKFIIPFMLLAVVFASCANDFAPNPVEQNMIINNRGLEIDLQWNTGGSDAEALAAADLDLELLHEGKLENISINDERFDELVLVNNAADGTYLVRVGYFDGDAAVSYKLTIAGLTGEKSMEFEGTFAPAESGSDPVEYLKITKRGDQYAISQL